MLSGMKPPWNIALLSARPQSTTYMRNRVRRKEVRPESQNCDAEMIEKMTTVNGIHLSGPKRFETS